MQKLPRLNDDSEILYRLWHGKQYIQARDLQSIFSISRETAVRVIRGVGVVPNVSGLNVSVVQLFKAYGWDMQKINKSHSLNNPHFK